jgi:hypothetical protein
MPLRDTIMASSSNFGGIILAVLRVKNRSMINAIPSTEQMIRGQIGQPAACMIENTGTLQMKTATAGRSDFSF